MRIILLFLSVCYSAVIKVPNDYTTIREGIDAAVEGDIVAAVYETGRLENGDLLLLAAFGGGFTWGSMLIRWGNK